MLGPRIKVNWKWSNRRLGFPSSSDGKTYACNAGDPASIPGSGRSPGEGNGNPLQYPCLENPMDREVWRATVHRVTKSQTQLKRLSTYTPVLHRAQFSSVQSLSLVLLFSTPWTLAH